MKIREIQHEDRAAWQHLWRGYIDFYKANIPSPQYDLTWQRLLDPDFGLHGLIAEKDGVALGIAHYSFQISTWAAKNYCYLEDLFVDPESRGQGLGRALIDAVKEIAISSGSSRFYWNTDATNESARRLYDSYTKESGKVQYRIALTAINE